MPRVKAKTTLLVGLILVTGCAAKPAPEPPVTGVTGSRDDPLEVPADFSVDLTVWAEPPQADGDAQVRPGRFILFCDGSLHWSGRVEHPEDEMPPLRRVLRRGDMAGVWTLIRQFGMDDPSRATPPVNVHLVEPPSGQVLYLAVLTGDGERWAFQRQTTAGRADPAMESLADRLSELAWADTPGAAPGAPRRYDFGPDPYARYRR